ncbi:unnamed protein product [Discosporangium mesarthrocarpum]
MVYNRRHPTEKYRVSLKLTSGALRTFFLSPGSKNAHAFWTLEDNITTFLRSFHWLWREFLEAEPYLKTLLEDKQRRDVAMTGSDLEALKTALNHLDKAMLTSGEPKSHGMTGNTAIGNVSDGGSGTSLPGRGGWDLDPDPDPDPDRGRGRDEEGLEAVAVQSSRLIFEMFYLTDELLYYALKHEGYVGDFALRLANLVYSVIFRHQVFLAFKPAPGERGVETAPVFLRRWAAHLNHFLGFFPHPKPAITPLVDLRNSLYPCFAPLVAGGAGRWREGVTPPDEAPCISPKAVTSRSVAGGPIAAEDGLS